MIKQRGTSFQADFSVGGRRYRRDFPTSQQAEVWENQVRGAILRGDDPAIVSEVREGLGCSTMEQLLQATFQRVWQGTKAERTSLLNGRSVIAAIGPTRHPSSVSGAVVDQAVRTWEAEGNSGGTINRKLSALRVMLTFAQKRGGIKHLPPMERRRESEHRIRWVTPVEEQAMLSWCESRGMTEFRDLLVLLVDTGLRLGEALSLKPSNCDGTWVRVWGVDAKNHSSRAVPMTSRVKEVVARRLVGVEDKLFTITANQVEHYWDRLQADLGLLADLQFVPHCLRHTFCSRLAQAGVHLQKIQQLAGHKTILTTLRYSHLAPNHLLDAIAVLEPVDKIHTNASSGHTVTACAASDSGMGMSVTSQFISAA